jgi:hypothetical protein
MSETLRRVQMLVALGQVRISNHGYDELANDGILAQEALAGLGTAVAVEDYAESDRGRSVLTIQEDAKGRPIHVVGENREEQSCARGPGHGLSP